MMIRKKLKPEIEKKYEHISTTLTVGILDIDNGFAEYANVKFVNIKSKAYTILVMANYQPTVGEMDGSVSILLNDNEIYYEHVTGFYHIADNKMNILITFGGNSDV